MLTKFDNFINESEVSPLFPWYSHVLDKYGLGDDMEMITAILMRASNRGYDKNKVYNLLIKNGVEMTPKATEELFSKFDELLRDSYRL